MKLCLSRSPLFPAALVALLSTAACSGDGDGDVVGDDGQDDGSGEGGGGDGGGDGPECAAASSFGDLGALTGVAIQANQPGTQGALKVFVMNASIAAGPPEDVLVVSLFDDFGAFSGGAVTTGDFELTGVETDPEQCGACVAVGANMAENTPEVIYVPTGGTLHIASIEGTLEGSAENLTFDAFDLSGNAIEGCSTTIAAVSFVAPIEIIDDGSGGGGGGGGNGGGGGGGNGGGGGGGG